MADDLINARNVMAGPELFERAIDRAITNGKMNGEARSLMVELYRGKVIVDPKVGTVEIDGLDLDAAIDKILVERPIFAAREATPEIRAQADLEAKALAGNVTAYAQLSKQLGPTAFAAWRAKHGNINAGQRPKAADKVDPANPWSGDGDRAAQLAIIRAPGGAAKAAALAKAAGKTLGGRPLPQRAA